MRVDAAAHPPQVETPTPRGRSPALDALRGFALFGIILVNAPFFAGPLRNLAPSGWLDALALWLIAAFAAGKFFLMFSFLFGFGFAMILARAEAQATPVAGRFFRRLAVLFVFGGLHAWLLFMGDILMLYAVLGVVLWCCRRWPLRRLLATATGVYLAGALLQIMALQAMSEAAAPPGANQPGAGYRGGFWSAAGQRLAELPESLGFIIAFNGAPALAMFLIGLALGRSGAFPPDSARLARLQPLFRRCLAIGAAVSGLAALAPFVTSNPALVTVSYGSLCLAAPVLSGGVAGIVLTLATRHEENRLVGWLARAGGSSMSGYFLHSILFGAIFYGWGLGLYGSLNPGVVFVIAVGVFAAVVVVLNMWRRFYRYGPDEWLLRSIVDLEWKPLSARR
jgi:uncharacterized protein